MNIISEMACCELWQSNPLFLFIRVSIELYFYRKPSKPYLSVHWSGEWWKWKSSLVEGWQSDVNAHLHTDHFGETGWGAFLVGFGSLGHSHLFSVHHELSAENISFDNINNKQTNI